MNAPTSGLCRWGMGLDEFVANVQRGLWKPYVLTHAVAARLNVDPKHVDVQIDEHLGRPYLRIEVSA